MVFQQWSGVNAIIFNTVTIFNAANVNINQYLATNIVGVVQLIATFCECFVNLIQIKFKIMYCSKLKCEKVILYISEIFSLHFSVSVLVVDRAGRRILLLISGIVMALPMACIGSFFYIFRDPESANQEWLSTLQWVPLVCLIIYMIGYSIGFACVPFLLMGEMLPGKKYHIFFSFF